MKEPKMKHKEPRYVHYVAIAGLLALTLTACNRSPDNTVKIAHAGPLTGSIAHQGKDDENGVRLAIDRANAQNIVIGGKVVRFEMLSEDDQADPKIGTTVAQKLVDAKVVAVIGHLNSGVSIPASEIYAKAGIPMISGSATDPTLTERGLKTVFRTVGRAEFEHAAVLQLDFAVLGAVKTTPSHPGHPPSAGSVFKPSSLPLPCPSMQSADLRLMTWRRRKLAARTASPCSVRRGLLLSLLSVKSSQFVRRIFAPRRKENQPRFLFFFAPLRLGARIVFGSGSSGLGNH